MTKTKSLKAMIRDRITKMSAVDIALKWCKAKERWIDHVYSHFVNIYIDKEERYNATRTVLGISSKYRNFNFYKTIDWENIDEEEVHYWESIYSWVNWFQSWAKYIEQDVQYLNYEEIREKYCRTLSDPDKFAKYLMEKFS